MPPKPLSITEQARRAQLIGVTIDLVSRHGYPGTSLARIAEAAGISKAAVLYHFPSKDAVVRTAYSFVLDAMVREVGVAIDAQSGAAAVDAYVRSMVAYMRDHPTHTRMIIEAMGSEAAPDDTPGAPSRRASVAGMIAAAIEAGDYRPGVHPAATAVIVNGAVDAIIAEGLADPSFDTAQAAEGLVAMLRDALGA